MDFDLLAVVEGVAVEEGVAGVGQVTMEPLNEKMESPKVRYNGESSGGGNMRSIWARSSRT